MSTEITQMLGQFTEDQIDKLNKISKDQENQKKLETQNIDKDAFLKLFMTQLQYQDPLSPMDNKDFIAQMAQFSSVEQLTNIASSTSASLSNDQTLSAQIEAMNQNIVELINKVDGSDNADGTDADGDGENDSEITDESLRAALKEIKEVNTDMLNQLISINAANKAYSGE